MMRELTYYRINFGGAFHIKAFESMEEAVEVRNTLSYAHVGTEDFDFWKGKEESSTVERVTVITEEVA